MDPPVTIVLDDIYWIQKNYSNTKYWVPGRCIDLPYDHTLPLSHHDNRIVFEVLVWPKYCRFQNYSFHVSPLELHKKILPWDKLSTEDVLDMPKVVQKEVSIEEMRQGIQYAQKWRQSMQLDRPSLAAGMRLSFFKTGSSDFLDYQRNKLVLEVMPDADQTPLDPQRYARFFALNAPKTAVKSGKCNDEDDFDMPCSVIKGKKRKAGSLPIDTESVRRASQSFKEPLRMADILFVLERQHNVVVADTKDQIQVEDFWLRRSVCYCNEKSGVLNAAASITARIQETVEQNPELSGIIMPHITSKHPRTSNGKTIKASVPNFSASSTTALSLSPSSSQPASQPDSQNSAPPPQLPKLSKKVLAEIAQIERIDADSEDAEALLLKFASPFGKSENRPISSQSSSQTASLPASQPVKETAASSKVAKNNAPLDFKLPRADSDDFQTKPNRKRK